MLSSTILKMSLRRWNGCRIAEATQGALSSYPAASSAFVAFFSLFYPTLYTSKIHFLCFCIAVNHFFVDIFDMVIMCIGAALHNRKSTSVQCAPAADSIYSALHIFIIKSVNVCSSSISVRPHQSIHHHKSVKKLSQRSLTWDELLWGLRLTRQRLILLQLSLWSLTRDDFLITGEPVWSYLIHYINN